MVVTFELLTQVEALDILAEISLDGNPERDNVVKKIQEIIEKKFNNRRRKIQTPLNFSE